MIACVDPNLSAFAIAVVTVLGGFLTAVVVTKLNVQATGRLERAKWKRELYASFLHSCNEVRDAIHEVATFGGSPDEGWATESASAQKTLWEIEMVAPTMKTPSETLWTALMALVSGVLRVDKSVDRPDGYSVIPVDRSSYEQLDEVCRLATIAFREAAAEDLK